MESTAKKYKLVYCPTQKLLFLDHLVLFLLYRDKKKGKSIKVELPKERNLEIPLITSSPQLRLGVCTAKTFILRLLNPLNLGLLPIRAFLILTIFAAMLMPSS